MFVFVVFAISSIKAPPDTLWTRTFGGGSPGCDEHSGDAGRSILETNDGGFIIAGWTHSYGVAGSDIRIIRTNELGDTLWTCVVGDSLDNVGYSIQKTFDHGFIITGFNYEPGGRGGG
jgi:hypothetical protein